MGLDRDPITKTIYGDLKREIELCYDDRLYASAAIILFSSIDILAHLGRPSEKVEGDADDFIKWTARYLLPHLPPRITAEEVYSARCAVLHALGVESRRTRAGGVRRVGFTAGGGPPIACNPAVDKTLMLLNLDALIQAFFKAIDKFLVEACSETRRRAVVEERLGQMLIPYSPPEEKGGGQN